MKIRQMMVILFVCLSVLPLIVLGITNMRYYNDKLEIILASDLTTAIRTQVKAIDNFYEERETDSAVIIGYRIVQRLLQAAAEGDAGKLKDLRQQVNDLLNSHTSNNRFVDSVTILDKNFVVLACSVPKAVGEVSVVSDMNLSGLEHGLRFTNVVKSDWDGQEKRVVVAIQKIYYQGEFFGYLIQELNLIFFEEMRTAAELFNNGTTYIVDGKSQMIAAGDTVSSRDEYELAEEERADYKRAWNEKGDEKEGIITYTARGVRYMSCYSQFEHMDWTILSSVNIDEVLETQEGIQELSLLIVAVLALLLVAIRIIFSKGIAEPFDRMIHKFNKIKETKDYSIRMDEIGKNEIAVISEEINSLLSSIQAYISLEQKKHVALQEKAQRDPLTGILNKKTIETMICDALEQEKPVRVACLFVDVDDFKNFNTQYGHMGGDQVLCFIARELEKYAHGLAGRQGGDEFVAFLNDAPEAPALEESIKELLAILNNGLILGEENERIAVRCSIGAILTESTISYADLIRFADEAMYQVKHSGKNSYVVLTFPNSDLSYQAGI